jgi:hypothetical protein
MAEQAPDTHITNYTPMLSDKSFTKVSGEADVICTLDKDLFDDDDTREFCVALGICVCTNLELTGHIKRQARPVRPYPRRLGLMR